jgi:hypothetical protein
VDAREAEKEAPAGVGAQRSAARGPPRGPHNALWGLRRLVAGRAEPPPPDTNRSLLSPLHYFTFVGLHSSFAQKHGLSCSSGRAVCHFFPRPRAHTGHKKSPLTFGCESANLCACRNKGASPYEQASESASGKRKFHTQVIFFQIITRRSIRNQENRLPIIAPLVKFMAFRVLPSMTKC